MQPETKQKISNLAFLQDGGEMGERTRRHDWTLSPIGTPDNWPQSLRTTLGILLHSAFPMFLFWGEELTCFYNDAFRPSLGNDGKHPAVGKRGREVWPEIWEFIGPLIEKVMSTGEPVWFENALVPFYRNGTIENIYWTFSYSPAYGDNGEINGVFVTCTETTKTVNTMQQLEESKEQLAFAIEAAELATWDFNPQTNRFIADARYTEWFGLSAEESTDNDLSVSIIAEEDQERVRQALAAALDPATGGRFDLEYNIRPHNRPERTLRAKGKATFDEAGNACRLTGTLQDVSAQVLTKKKLIENEARFRTLIEEAPVATALYTGPELRIEYANNIMIGYWGKDASVVGKTFRAALPELHSQHFPDSLDKVFASGKPYTGVRERADLVVDGKLQTYYFNFTYKPLRNKEGVIYGIHHMAIDVTREVLTQQQLEESENNLRNLILKAPVAMCIFKGAGYRVEIVNDLMLQSWDKKEEEVLNRPFYEALPEAKGQGFEELLHRVYTTGETVSALEAPVTLTRNGVKETHYVNLVYQALRAGDGTISGIMIVNIDVTEQVLARRKIEESEASLQKRVEERTTELAEANLELKRSNANLEEFAYAASHDMKEPIRKIHFFSDRLRGRLAGKLAPDDARYFERMESAARRMSTLIDDLLLYSHISRGASLEEAIDLNEVIALVREDLELETEEKGAVLTIGPLPSLKGHKRQLQQLFQNLIGNSLKYIRPGILPEVAVTCSEVTASGDKPHYLIEVRDNGIGFEQPDAERIFNVFTRLHGNSEYRGTGVGLSIVRKVVENHHGRIEAEGRPGEGAAFKIYLPVL